MLSFKPHRWQRVWIAMGLLGLFIITSCIDRNNLGKATLNLDHRVFYLDHELPSQSLTITNIGTPDSVLAWHVTNLDPNVMILSGGKSGRLKSGEKQTLIVSTVTQVKAAGKQLVIESNGGTQTVYVNFTPIPGQGLESCGSFPATNTVARDIEAPSQEKPLGDFVPGELIIKYRTPFLSTQDLSEDLSSQDSSAQNATQLQARLQQQARSVEVDYQLSVQREASLNVPALVTVAGDVAAMAKVLSNDPRVEYAEPNYYLETLGVPNDPLLSQQWNLNDFGLSQAWSIETGSKNEVIVAVIDSGFDMEHQDLKAKLLPGCDFHDQDSDLNPHLQNTNFTSHGTHVAGIVGAIGNNTVGVSGVAYGPKTKILPIKVFDNAGQNGTLDDLINAIWWASGAHIESVAPNIYKADVINMSLGNKFNSASLGEALQYARDQGITLFASAGNKSLDAPLSYPAADKRVIAVGSVDQDMHRSDFSSYYSAGRSVDLIAPGGLSTSPAACLGVPSTILDDQYGCLSGTSMASPFAAGVAALLLGQNPNLSPEQIKAKLTGSAFFDNTFMTTTQYGAGVICADKTLGAPTQCGK
jgi:subtilisin family serine protease